MIERKNEMVIWTLGHSTHSFDEFMRLLDLACIRCIVDIRLYPGSKRYPQFNRENLNTELEKKEVRYIHMVDLGGRRVPKPDSSNIAWKNAAFRGYADYMETPTFITAVDELQAIAEVSTTAVMCAEGLWWKCHRALVSDYLKMNGWKVMHIMPDAKQVEHPYTKAANIIHGKIDYTNSQGKLFPN